MFLLTHYNYRWWNNGEVVSERNNTVAGEFFLGDHVGGDQDGLCRHQDETAQQEEALHLSLRNKHRGRKQHTGFGRLVLCLGKKGFDHFSVLATVKITCRHLTFFVSSFKIIWHSYFVFWFGSSCFYSKHAAMFRLQPAKLSNFFFFLLLFQRWFSFSFPKKSVCLFKKTICFK